MPEDIQVGMTADQVLRLDGRNRWAWIRKSRKVGVERDGPIPDLIVEWYYRDCTVTFKKRLLDGVTAYRVTEIVPKETKEARRARQHRARRRREASYA